MRSTFGTATLRLAFVLTGVGTALLGAALPAMLLEWHLDDRGGGSLLLSSFTGATLGALPVRGRYRLLACCGLGATAVAAFWIAGAAGGRMELAFLLYGTGLGVTMTSISVLRSRLVSATDSNLEMNRLNLLWAVGACVAPALALHSLHLVSVRTLFRSEAAVFSLAAGLISLSGVTDAGAGGRPSLARTQLSRLVPVRLCLFAASAVALETAIGGWLTTYTARAAGGIGIAVWANSIFWLGLLVSRGLHSFRAPQWLQSPWVTAVHLLFATIAVVLLVAAPYGGVLPVAALLAGLGLGPLYPLALSAALPRYHSNAIFVATGVGAALLPWLTGMLSTVASSLRFGLLAPCATVLILLGSGFSARRQFHQPV